MLLEKSWNQGVFECCWLGREGEFTGFSLMTRDIRRFFFEKYFYNNSWLSVYSILSLASPWNEFCKYAKLEESEVEKGYPLYYAAIRRVKSPYSFDRISDSDARKFLELAAYFGHKESMIKLVKSYGMFEYFMRLGGEDRSRIGSQSRIDMFNAKICELNILRLEHKPSELDAIQNYFIGAFIERDTTKAIAFLNEAVNQGYKAAMLHLGLKIKAKDLLKSIQYLREAEDAGVLEAKYELYKLSRELIPSSKNTFDFCDDNKISTKEDYLRIGNMFLNAYRNGHVYIKEKKWEVWCNAGGGWRQSYAQYLRYFANEKAAECFYRGGEYDKVIELLNDSITIKGPKGMTYLGLCYYNGYGVVSNKEYAMTLLEKAAKLEDADALFTLGNICRKSGDFENAVHWYLRSAHFGCKDAMKNLALCYDRGLGVKKDSHRARFWMDAYKGN